MKITYPLTPSVTSNGVTLKLPVNLSYRPGFDPYAIAIVLFPSTLPITWLIGRELLRDGLSRPVGESAGCIRITPGDTTIGVRRAGPLGAVQLVFARGDIASFVKSVFLQVPGGTEHKHLNWSDLPEVLA